MNRDIRICFVGDSFVNGTGDETALGWAGRLCAAANLRGHAVTYYNLGIRRNTSRDILQRWQQECLSRLPTVCDGRILFSFGVNDTVLEDGELRVPFEESCTNLRNLLQDAGQYSVLLVGPPPVDDVEQNKRIAALSAVFAQEAPGFGIPFVDLFTPLVFDKEYLHEVAGNDGAHPTSKGYTKMAQIIESSPSWWFPAK